MRRYILHEPFSIYHFEAETWNHSVHNHTYFEIIFILKGHGVHHINGCAFDYKSGDVFLLGPEDFHHFDIISVTEFSFVRFNESQHRQISGNEDRPWRPIIKMLLGTSSQSRSSIIYDPVEKKKLHQLLTVLEIENRAKQSHYFDVVRDSLLRTMLVILARNLFVQGVESSVLNRSAEGILMYVKQNIFKPENLTITHLAKIFNYSGAYIGNFFKRKTGESLKKYIIKYKIGLIKTRLEKSKTSLKDISFEFGYTDESHLCKQFRQYTGHSPNVFRKLN